MQSSLPSHILRGAAVAEGGEAIIYEVVGHPEILLKVFRHGLSRQKRACIERLISATSAGLRQFAACPLRIEHDGNSIIMPRLYDCRPVHQLYDTSDRKRYFQRAHWGSIITAAHSVAQACAAVHAAGFALADISENNSDARYWKVFLLLS